jgi:8-oxo-dGTP pyrophosphatase MutT (NUDIX family)
MNRADEIPDIHEYLERLRNRLTPAEAVARPAPDERRAAAVLVPLMNRGGGRIDVLYTRRSDRLMSHRGQVAFPGGRFDRRDPDLRAAALRETHEEVGLAPDLVRVLGSFPGRRTNQTDIAVTPFVGVIDGSPELTPDPKEVADIFTVPLEALRDPRYRGKYNLERDGVALDFPAILYAGQVIWGLTFSITLTFLELVESAERE